MIQIMEFTFLQLLLTEDFSEITPCRFFQETSWKKLLIGYNLFDWYQVIGIPENKQIFISSKKTDPLKKYKKMYSEFSNPMIFSDICSDAFQGFKIIYQ